MTQAAGAVPRRSRLAALPEHFSVLADPRDVRRILHPSPKNLPLVVCGAVADSDSPLRTMIRRP